MSPYQYPQYGVPGFQPQTMQQMVGQGYSPAPSLHPQPGISGRVVTSPGEIQVQEVPTDGTVAWFPAADGSRGRSGYRMESPDGEGGRMGYKNQYGNWPANPANRRRRMRRRGYTEESVENIRSMMEEADPARREQLKRDLEELMREM